jgi:hypothetical protein
VFVSTDKRKALQTILAKLEKLLPHLGNANPHEAAAALGKINKLLADAKLDWHDLITLMLSDTKQSSLLDLLSKLILGDAALLIKIGLKGATFFHHGSDAFADVVADGHRHTWPLSSTDFHDWLLLRYFAELKMLMVPSAAAMKTAIRTLNAHAKFEGEQREVFLRAAFVDGKIYLDVGDPEWSTIEIDRNGWRMIEDSPARFRRTQGMQALPLPERGGSIIKQLRPLLNLTDDGFVLYVSWILDALCPIARPHPLLYLAGEEGSAKSTAAKIARSLIDPNAVPLRNLPGTVRDLFVSVDGSRAMAYDNIGSISPAISDALCMVATGSGFGARRLYTDAAQILIGGSRPVILNGLLNAIDRSDLADRAVVVQMSPISQDKRFSEAEIWKKFEAQRSQIFGALLDCVANGLRKLPGVQLQRLPRMADFALWSVATEAFADGAFLQAFESAAEEAVEAVAEVDPVVVAVTAFMIEPREDDRWTGTAAKLLQELSGREIGEAASSRWKTWPAEPSSFSRRLRKASAVLRKLGVGVEVGRASNRSRTREITLTKIEAQNCPKRPDRPGPDADIADGLDSLDSLDGSDGSSVIPMPRRYRPGERKN